MRESKMKSIVRQATTRTRARRSWRCKKSITPIQSGVFLLAIGCALFAQALWAGAPDNGAALAPAAMDRVDTTVAKAAGENPAGVPKQASGIQSGWKPPKMPEPRPFSTQKIDPEIAKELKARWGVELLGVRNAAAGNFLDFRFRVLDAEKSLPLFDHRIKPYVVAEKSDIKLPVPMAAKIGAFRPTNRGKNIKADKIYYMLFGNPDRHVKTGEKVTVVIGDFKVEHLEVN